MVPKTVMMDDGGRGGVGNLVGVVMMMMIVLRQIAT